MLEEEGHYASTTVIVAAIAGITDQRRQTGRRRAGLWRFRPHRTDSHADLTAQQGNVLHGGDDPVLDLLPPQTPPACSFEVIPIRRVRKAALHQVATAVTISVCFGQTREGARDLER